MDRELITLLVKLALAVISVLVTGYVIPWIKSRIDTTKFNDFLVLVEMCVEAANQIYTPEEWASKKKYVLDITESYIKEHGVEITADELNAIIEGFVIAVKG